jgi:hypothetical protein
MLLLTAIRLKMVRDATKHKEGGRVWRDMTI